MSGNRVCWKTVFYNIMDLPFTDIGRTGINHGFFFILNLTHQELKQLFVKKN